jgi:hypothetical protein
MTSPAKDHAPPRAYYFKLKIMTCEIQNSQLACLIVRHYKARSSADAAEDLMLWTSGLPYGLASLDERLAYIETSKNDDPRTGQVHAGGLRSSKTA